MAKNKYNNLYDNQRGINGIAYGGISTSLSNGNAIERGRALDLAKLAAHRAYRRMYPGDIHRHLTSNVVLVRETGQVAHIFTRTIG